MNTEVVAIKMSVTCIPIQGKETNKRAFDAA